MLALRHQYDIVNILTWPGDAFQRTFVTKIIFFPNKKHPNWSSQPPTNHNQVTLQWHFADPSSPDKPWQGGSKDGEFSRNQNGAAKITKECGEKSYFRHGDILGVCGK